MSKNEVEDKKTQKPKIKSNYVQVSIPKGMMEQIDRIVEISGDYRTKTEFIIDNLRDAIKVYKKEMALFVLNDDELDKKYKDISDGIKTADSETIRKLRKLLSLR